MKKIVISILIIWMILFIACFVHIQSFQHIAKEQLPLLFYIEGCFIIGSGIVFCFGGMMVFMLSSSDPSPWMR